jgi:adenine-specific DNA-methyltransferase
MSLPQPYYERDGITIYHGRCEDVVPHLPVVDLIATDPPYNGVLDAQWDNAWDGDAAFLDWVRVLSVGWQGKLAANGSLYCFAWPNMAARVECVIRERFSVLASIAWRRPNSRGGKAEKESLRSFFPATERIVFAEHPNSDGIARGVAGYVGACDGVRGDVFEPIRAYLDGERERAGITRAECNAICGNQMAGHYFSQSQWALPTAENYAKLRAAFNARGGEFLRKDYEELRKDYEELRKDYEELRKDYEELRRPFFLRDGMQWSDVWEFKPEAGFERSEHPCQKPLAMMQHIVAVSSRPNALVLDPFMGSGTTLVAAKLEGRRAIGIEIEERYCEIAAKRLAQGVLNFG